MAIDPSIPLAVQPVKFNTPFEALGQVQQLRAQQQEVELRKQQIEASKAQELARRQQVADDQLKVQKEKKYNEIISRGLSREEFVKAIQVEAPDKYEGVVQRMQEHDKHALEMEKLSYEAEAQKKTWVNGLLQDVANSGYSPFVAAAVMSEVETRLPQYKPQMDAIREKLIADGPGALKATVDQLLPKKEIKTREIATRQPDGSELKQIVEDKPGQSFTSAPPVKEPASIDAAILAASKTGDGVEMRRLLNLKGQMNAAGRAPEKDTEPLVPIMGPDGKPVLVRRSQAEGKAPASTREQGRAVPATTASKIAELDTALDDLKALGSVLGKTGAGSRVGAALPNVVTEMTGLGADSKSRQGTIDRVKQVIGKTLEGGVLRKEDEIKYEKILPTIGDPPSVAKTKLEGLHSALTQKRQREIDALTDANYDTTNFEKRTTSGAGGGPKEGDRKPIDGYPGTEQTFKGGKWIRTK